MNEPLLIESGRLSLPAAIIHGGAGEFARCQSEEEQAALERVLGASLEAAWEVLCSGGPALEAVVEAVVVMEASGRFNAGRGAVATTLGTVETDAAVMDGRSGRVGAICAATWPASPVRAARAVLELGGPATGPVLLAGTGADRFCELGGLARRDPALLTGEGVLPLSASGTVGAVALDALGHVASATSTGGLTGQLPGRVGDTPVIGAGTWADDRNAAVSATGEGEFFVVAGFAHLVGWALEDSMSLEEAIGGALEAVRGRGGHGGAIALCPDGEFAVAFDTPAMARAWRDGSGLQTRPLRGG